MKTLLLAAALLLATSAVARQQDHPPYNTPPQGTPPIVGDQDSPRQVPPDAQLPPDSQAPATSTQTSTEIQQQIESKIGDEPGLAGSRVNVDVNDRGITLSGTVDSEQQHDLAVRIAQSYAGDRPIDDKITLRSKS